MVIAGAGSGKTRVLTFRIAYLMDQGVDAFNILALTFTNKAAREMKKRISEIVGAEAKNLWMGTFHSVFAKLLRYDGSKLGYPSNFTIYDTQDSQRLISSIIKEMALDKDIYKYKQVQNRISSFKNSLITVKAYLQNPELMEADAMAKRPRMGEIYQNYVDYDFLDLFEIDLLTGRNFSPAFPRDSSDSYILNESAVKKLGWDNASAIGKSFADGKVIGVMKDFHFLRLDFAIEPLYLTFHNKRTMSYFGNIVLKMNMENPENTIAYVQNTLKTVMPQLPFEHRYLDESFNQLYQAEKRFGAAFNIFTLIALFIACIGLFGLVTHSVLLRTKEIGIRKVLGASIPNLVYLLCKDFGLLILIAFLIATPLSWYFMNQWLSDFAYATSVGLGVFLFAGALI